MKAGRFREDLLARINVWTFRFPGLRERVEDIEPNLRYELEQQARATGTNMSMNEEARVYFLEFATSKEAVWSGNFRDLNAALARMATLAHGGRIALDVVEDEIERLRANWRTSLPDLAGSDSILNQLMEPLRVRKNSIPIRPRSIGGCRDSVPRIEINFGGRANAVFSVARTQRQDERRRSAAEISGALRG